MLFPMSTSSSPTSKFCSQQVHLSFSQQSLPPTMAPSSPAMLCLALLVMMGRLIFVESPPSLALNWLVLVELESLANLDLEMDLEMDFESDLETDFDVDVQQDLFAIEKIITLSFNLLSIDAPNWYINPDFTRIFRERANFDNIAKSCSISLPTSVQTIMDSDKPPPFSFFKSLPAASPIVWGIYAVCLEKEHEKPLLYIGSGTSGSLGVRSRVASYKSGKAGLPINIRRTFDKGFHISHIGLLCWGAIPSAGLVPGARGFYLAVEAAFTMIFHAKYIMVCDIHADPFLPWPQATVPWIPACSHLSLTEAIQGSLDATSEELEFMAAIRLARLKKQALVNSQEHRSRKRAVSIDAYRAHDRVQKNAWSAKNRGKLRKVSSQNREKNKNSARFRCDTCDMNLQSAHALEKHNGTQQHQDRVAGVPKRPPSKYAAAAKAVLVAAKENKLHYCSTCDKAFGNKFSLDRHNATPRHLKTLQEAQVSQP
jgi:hypothetical protein